MVSRSPRSELLIKLGRMGGLIEVLDLLIDPIDPDTVDLQCPGIEDREDQQGRRQHDETPEDRPPVPKVCPDAHRLKPHCRDPHNLGNAANVGV